MAASTVVVAFGLLCLAGYPPAMGQDSYAEAAADIPREGRAQSQPLFVIGLVPPADQNATDTNQVPEERNVELLLPPVNQDGIQQSPLASFISDTGFRPLFKREAHHENGAPHEHTHDNSDGHDHSQDGSKDPKSRQKRGYCSKCGGQLGYGGGGGYGNYGGGYGGGGYGQGGCGGGCGGGGRPVYSQPIYQTQPYYGGGGGNYCNTCGRPIGGGGGYGGGQSYSQSSSSSSSSSYGRK